MESPHILLVEDDASLAAWIADYLVSLGYLVSVATQGDIALDMIDSDKPDAVVLDLGLPVVGGLAVCQRARAFYSGPIVMLTARDEDEDEIRGLECGADDYLIKPVRPRVLHARLHRLLSRGQDVSAAPTINIGQLVIDVSARRVLFAGQDIELSTQEFDVLQILAERAGHTVDRQTLATRLRGLDYDGFDRSVDLAVSRLRKRLGDDGKAAKRIRTVRGSGYLLSPDAWQT